MIKRIVKEDIGSASEIQLHPMQWLGSNTDDPNGVIFTYPIKWNAFLPDNWRLSND